MASKKAIQLLVVTIVAAVSVILFLYIRKQPENQSATLPSVVEAAKGRASESPLAADNSQISLKHQTKEQAMHAWWKRRENDKRADWKVPIRFYGRVVDETMMPVVGAAIHFIWTDTSTHGTSEADTVSDERGLFSLTGAHGKHLSVYVSKDGYHTPVAARTAAFEFAVPSDQNYYEPNPKSPVLFRLRKRGEGAHLVKGELRVLIPFGEEKSATVDLLNGKESPKGQLEIRASKPEKHGVHFPYDWRFSMTIPDGGFVEQNDEFGFEAPETGYRTALDYQQHAENGAKGVFVEGKMYFVFGTPKRYGRLHFETGGDSRRVSIEYVLNPTGSRNLEYDPNEQAPAR